MPAATAGGRAYRRLFAAHVLGLLATGITTVALALIAFDLVGDGSGAVLGTALAIKMAVNIVVTPLVAGIAARLERRRWLAALVAVRAGTVGLIPFLDQVWHIYALIAVFQTASAAFVATYLAAVPSLLPGEEDYARAVAKSRIAYTLEGLLSPLAAAGLLLVVEPGGVFAAAAVLFLVALPVILGTAFPACEAGTAAVPPRQFGAFGRLLAVPALRGGLALSAAAITVSAMVTVNTVVLVQGAFDLDERSAAIALAAFGAGGVAAALALHRLIGGQSERRVMLSAGALMAGLLVAGSVLPGYGSLLALWLALGATSTLAQLPLASLIRRYGRPEERLGLYAGHYAFDHAILLVAYLAAGWIVVEDGMSIAFVGLGLAAGLMVALAALVWREAPPRPG